MSVQDDEILVLKEEIATKRPFSTFVGKGRECLEKKEGNRLGNIEGQEIKRQMGMKGGLKGSKG